MLENIAKIINDLQNTNSQSEKMQLSTRRDLLEEASNIGDLKRYNMMLQNISLRPNVKDYLNNNRNPQKEQ